MKFIPFITCILVVCIANAQQNNSPAMAPDTARLSPVVLPGKGLAQHDMFYAGENSVLSMYIIKNGKIDWSYTHPGKGEISDATLLPDGSVLFAHQFGVTKINHDKKILWHYDAPPGTEIHTAQAIGKDYVVLVRNGKPAQLNVINITTGTIEKAFDLPVAHPESVHGQFRQARLTDAGTILVGHMDANRVVEYDANGKELWSATCPEPWSAVPLKNGNVLVSTGGHKTVVELNRKGETVWQFSPADLPGFTFANIQVSNRLNNGHTIINNWGGKGNGTVVQAVEVDGAKKLVWALRAWDAPADLGRSTTIQLLDKPTENRHFGPFR